MKKFVSIFLLLLGVFVLFCLLVCGKYPQKLTDAQAEEIAKPYFQERYKMNVVIKKVVYKRVSYKKQYLNFITVSNGSTNYELALDKKSRPMADNISSTEIVKDIDLSMLEAKFKPLELGLAKFGELCCGFSYQDRQYIVQLSAESVSIPEHSSADGIYSLLNMLKDKGINEFIIEVCTPDFLLPKMESGYGGYGIQLAAESFDTDIDEKSFGEQYDDFSDKVYWDEQKFEKEISQLTEIGYENAHFYISKYIDGNTIEIVLYCESGSSLDDEQATALLEGMDDSYFKIDGKKIKYTLQHVYK